MLRTIIYLSTFLFLFSSYTYAQECKVLMEDIAGEYIGDCKKGLAHGEGIAKGTDTYQGEFKKGLPHGEGKYTWANGDVYEGDWKKGVREGNGTYTFKLNGKDSIQVGIWNENKYIGKEKVKPYKIKQKVGVARYTMRKVMDGNRFKFIINDKMNEVESILTTASSGQEMNNGREIEYDNIVFPFTFVVTYSIWNDLHTAKNNVRVEIEVVEPGYWELTVY